MAATIPKQSRTAGRPVSTRDFPAIRVRLPPDLYQQVIASAAADYRSLNSEIIARLRQAFATERAK